MGCKEHNTLSKTEKWLNDKNIKIDICSCKINNLVRGLDHRVLLYTTLRSGLSVRGGVLHDVPRRHYFPDNPPGDGDGLTGTSSTPADVATRYHASVGTTRYHAIVAAWHYASVATWQQRCKIRNLGLQLVGRGLDDVGAPTVVGGRGGGGQEGDNLTLGFYNVLNEQSRGRV